MKAPSNAAQVLPRAEMAVLRRNLTSESLAYDRVFWFTYLANGLTTIANAMLVRYADFVNLLGGEEKQLGLLVGVGMLGSIAMRLVQGVSIDRYGAARIWQASMAMYAASLFAHLALTSAYGPAAFVTRIVMQSALAGVFGSSITFMSLRVAPSRMAEIIGALGTSGFLGILIGPQISDWICRGPVVSYPEIRNLFLTAGGMAILATLATGLATTGIVPPAPRRQPSISRLVRRYMVLSVALVAAAMGAGFIIPMTFLRPFATELGISSIGLFFAVYAGTAFLARLLTRNLFERHGNRPWIIVGLSLLTISYLMYLPVSRLWHLVLPGAVAGIAHALLFPAVVSAGTTTFPRRLRGIATSLILAMFDLGTFLGAPVVGAFVQYARQHTPAAYPLTFASVAAVLTVVTLLFWFFSPNEDVRAARSA